MDHIESLDVLEWHQETTQLLEDLGLGNYVPDLAYQVAGMRDPAELYRFAPEFLGQKVAALSDPYRCPDCLVEGHFDEGVWTYPGFSELTEASGPTAGRDLFGVLKGIGSESIVVQTEFGEVRLRTTADSRFEGPPGSAALSLSALDGEIPNRVAILADQPLERSIGGVSRPLLTAEIVTLLPLTTTMTHQRGVVLRTLDRSVEIVDLDGNTRELRTDQRLNWRNGQDVVLLARRANGVDTIIGSTDSLAVLEQLGASRTGRYALRRHCRGIAGQIYERRCSCRGHVPVRTVGAARVSERPAPPSEQRSKPCNPHISTSED